MFINSAWSIIWWGWHEMRGRWGKPRWQVRLYEHRERVWGVDGVPARETITTVLECRGEGPARIVRGSGLRSSKPA